MNRKDIPGFRNGASPSNSKKPRVKKIRNTLLFIAKRNNSTAWIFCPVSDRKALHPPNPNCKTPKMIRKTMYGLGDANSRFKLYPIKCSTLRIPHRPVRSDQPDPGANCNNDSDIEEHIRDSPSGQCAGNAAEKHQLTRIEIKPLQH